MAKTDIKIVTWNVNSINKRLDRVLAFLKRESPEVVCLQELKCMDDKFPLEAITAAGYNSAVFGQKAYNGVAILSKEKLTKVQRGFGDDNADQASRFISASTYGIQVMCAYCPNGQEPGSEKFAYKMEWFKRLRAYLNKAHKPSQPIIIVGDFNVAPEDRDVFDPIGWKDHIHCTKEERDVLANMVAFGFVDTFRQLHEDAGLYSWWDYREASFPQNKGLRIDMIYGTKPMAARLDASRIDRNERKGELPSDHAPVISTFKAE